MLVVTSGFVMETTDNKRDEQIDDFRHADIICCAERAPRGSKCTLVIQKYLCGFLDAAGRSTNIWTTMSYSCSVTLGLQGAELRAQRAGKQKDKKLKVM